MTHRQPHPELQSKLERFARGEATAEERQALLQHLLEGCDECSQELQLQLRPVVEEEALDAAVDRAVAHARKMARQLENHRERAEGLLVTLEARDPGERDATLGELDPSLLRTLAELALTHCHEVRHRNPERNLRLADLAVAASRHLDDGERPILQARAVAEQANAHRVCGDLHAASRGLERADELNRLAGEDPAVRADILAYRASLAMDQRQPEQALAHLEKALPLYTRLGDEQGAIEALICLALVENHRGAPQDGVQYLTEVLERLETQPNSRMEAIAIHDLITLTLEAGDVEEAAQLLEQSRSILEGAEDQLLRLRLDWLKARVADAQGRRQEAVAAMEKVRETYTELSMPYELALVSLDLAVLYAATGERGKQRELTSSAAEVFRNLSVGREALASLALLAKAEAEDAAELAARLSLVVENSRRRFS